MLAPVHVENAKELRTNEAKTVAKVYEAEEWGKKYKLPGSCGLDLVNSRISGWTDCASLVLVMR
jgi:hypothetical protein